LVIILLLALVLFGAGKLSEVGGALGKSIKEFRHAANGEDKPKQAAEEPGTPPKSTS